MDYLNTLPEEVYLPITNSFFKFRFEFKIRYFSDRVSFETENGFRAESCQTFGEQSFRSFAISGSNARKSSLNFCIVMRNPLKLGFQGRMVEITSNIWGTKFKIHGLDSSLPPLLVGYATSEGGIK